MVNPKRYRNSLAVIYNPSWLAVSNELHEHINIIQISALLPGMMLVCLMQDDVVITGMVLEVKRTHSSIGSTVYIDLYIFINGQVFDVRRGTHNNVAVLKT